VRVCLLTEGRTFEGTDFAWRERKPKRAVFSVKGIDCVTCSIALEKKLRSLEGVKEVRTALMLNNIFVDYDGERLDPSRIMEAIRESGYSHHVKLDG